MSACRIGEDLQNFAASEDLAASVSLAFDEEESFMETSLLKSPGGRNLPRPSTVSQQNPI